MQNTKGFVNENRIRAEVVMADTPMPEGFDRGGYAWKVTLKRGRKQMTVDFFTGSLCGEPTCEDVLDCLAMDASTLDYGDFEEWARGLGYDTDSRKAEATYKKVIANSKKLRKFLGDALYNRLVFDTERL